LVAGSETNNPGKHDDVKNLTTEESMRFAAGGLEKAEQEDEKGSVSNTE
jgi:hypothetical protein